MGSTAADGDTMKTIFNEKEIADLQQAVSSRIVQLRDTLLIDWSLSERQVFVEERARMEALLNKLCEHKP